MDAISSNPPLAVDDAPQRGGGKRPLPERTSEILAHVVDNLAGDRIAFGDILHLLGKQAFGFALLMFALVCCVPTPPGGATIAGGVLAYIAVQMVGDRDELWLPERMRKRTLSTEFTRKMIERTVPYLIRLERICRPRLLQMCDRTGRRAIGIVVLLLAGVILLPLPFLGNMPPGVAIVVIAVGLIERDGAVVVAGLASSVAAAVITSGMTYALFAAVL